MSDEGQVTPPALTFEQRQQAKKESERAFERATRCQVNANCISTCELGTFGCTISHDVMVP